MAIPLKYPSNFWGSLKMPLINCKVELKLRRIKHSTLASTGVENVETDSNNIAFTMKNLKLYVPGVTLLAKDNQKLLKRLSKGFERLVYWNKYETKVVNRNATNKCRYFLESKFVGVNKLFVLLYSNAIIQKCIVPKCIIYQNVLLRIIKISSMEKTFMTNQLILIQNDTKK